MSSKRLVASLVHTSEMTIAPVASTLGASATIALPTEPYQAVRLAKTS